MLDEYVAYSLSSLKFQNLTGEFIPHIVLNLLHPKRIHMGPISLVFLTAYHIVTLTPCNSTSCIYLRCMLTTTCYFDFNICGSVHHAL